jgi:hypothetical protein
MKRRCACCYQVGKEWQNDVLKAIERGGEYSAMRIGWAYTNVGSGSRCLGTKAKYAVGMYAKLSEYRVVENKVETNVLRGDTHSSFRIGHGNGGAGAADVGVSTLAHPKVGAAKIGLGIA